MVPMRLRKVFEEHIDKLVWIELSSNPNAIHLLEKIKIKLIGNGSTFIRRQYK
jgi:hypothetical protein